MADAIKNCKNCQCILKVGKNWLECRKRARYYICNSCQHSLYDKNKEEISYNQRIIYRKNKKKFQSKNRKYYIDNAEKAKLYAKKYRLKNKKKLKEKRKKDEIKIKATQKKYRENPINKKRKNERRRKNSQNPIIKIREYIRTYTWKIFKINDKEKNKHSEIYMDFNCAEYIKRIELLWGLPYNLDENGNIWMNWNNYGKLWHIDHIKPLSHFKITDENDLQIYQAISINNLRPLCAKRNMSENNKRTIKQISQIKIEIKLFLKDKKC